MLRLRMPGLDALSFFKNKIMVQCFNICLEMPDALNS